jgi:hypothetical protein
VSQAIGADVSGALGVVTTEALGVAWDAARKRWAQPVLLGAPRDDREVALARIDLSTRRVDVNLGAIAELGIEHTLEAILAHEVGHHLRYPGDLVTAARFALLERSIVAFEGFSCVNLFTDLMINERLGRELSRELADVYRALARTRKSPADDLFHFYVAIYEELWQLPRGELMDRDRSAFERRHPRYRADAHLLAQDLFHLGPDVFVQFVFFLSVALRYVVPGVEKALESLACACAAHPTPEDWARALVLDPRERRALERARAEGWLSPDEVDRAMGERSFERRVMALPGQGTAEAEAVPEIMAAWYRQQAERYLVRPPPQRRLGEAVVPTTLEDWEPGDPLVNVDWSATLRARGPALGAAQPLVRESIADEEGLELPRWQPRMEIYLDVSGSMPDPRRTRNAMTLAAQILATGTLKSGGWVRALLYSHEHVRYWTWCRSAVEISRFLMHYVGGGTQFPFAVLRESIDACRADPPIRVVISDHDFDHNVRADAAAHLALLRDAAAGSASLVLLLHRPVDELSKTYAELGARLVHVADLEDFPKVAAELARVLFDGGRS